MRGRAAFQRVFVLRATAFPLHAPLHALCLSLHSPSTFPMPPPSFPADNGIHGSLFQKLAPTFPGASSSHLRLSRPPTSLCSHLPVLTPPLFSLRFANPSLARTALCSIRFAHVHSFRPTRSFLRTRPCVVHRACAPASLRLAPPRSASPRLAPPRSASCRSTPSASRASCAAASSSSGATT